MALDGNNLIIGAFFNKVQPTLVDRSTYPFVEPNNNVAYGGAIYHTDVRKSASVQRIDQLKVGEIAGFNVAAHQGNVVFLVNYYDGRGTFSSYTILVSGKTSRSINLQYKATSFASNLCLLQSNSMQKLCPRWNAISCI